MSNGKEDHELDDKDNDMEQQGNNEIDLNSNLSQYDIPQKNIAQDDLALENLALDDLALDDLAHDYVAVGNTMEIMKLQRKENEEAETTRKPTREELMQDKADHLIAKELQRKENEEAATNTNNMFLFEEDSPDLESLLCSGLGKDEQDDILPIFDSFGSNNFYFENQK